ncbi:MAG: hypothetical protein HY814_11400 [Candidatus Riflebacteria bacterium]|nr:hypothetical protein [Candidatus Riflebacteria bacterium]
MFETVAGTGKVELPSEPDGPIQSDTIILGRRRHSYLHLHQVLAVGSPAPLPDPRALLVWTVLHLDADWLTDESGSEQRETSRPGTRSSGWPSSNSVQAEPTAKTAPRPEKPRRRPTRKRSGPVRLLSDVRAEFDERASRHEPFVQYVYNEDGEDRDPPEQSAAAVPWRKKPRRARRRHRTVDLRND